MGGALAGLRKGESSKLAAQRKLSGRGTVYKEKHRQADTACAAFLVQLYVHRAAAGPYRVRRWTKRELTGRYAESWTPDDTAIDRFGVRDWENTV